MGVTPPPFGSATTYTISLSIVTQLCQAKSCKQLDNTKLPMFDKKSALMITLPTLYAQEVYSFNPSLLAPGHGSPKQTQHTIDLYFSSVYILQFVYESISITRDKSITLDHDYETASPALDLLFQLDVLRKKM